MLPWAWNSQLWVEQMIYFGLLLTVIAGITMALFIMLAAVVGILERIKDEATSKLNPDQESLVHVLNFRHRKSADV